MASSKLLPESIAIFAAFQGALVFWLVLHVVSTTLAGLFYKKIRFPWSDASPYLSGAAQSLVQAAIAPLNAAVAYASQVLALLAGSWQWVALASLLVVGGYVMTNYQTAVFVTVDTTWTAFHDVAVTPVRTLGNIFFVILEIVVGLVNFLSQYSGTVLRHTGQSLLHTEGYHNSSIYDIFQNGALSISNGVVATSAWVSALSQIRRGVHFVADQTSSESSGGYGMDTSILFYEQASDQNWPGHFELTLPPQLNLTGAVAPLRMATYDLLLRIKSTCPAESGLLDIVMDGVIDPKTDALDKLVSCGVNTMLSLPEAFIISLVVYSKTGRYFPPNVDAFFDTLDCAAGAAADLANALFINSVNYVQSMIIETLDYGFSSEIAAAPRWKPVAIFVPVYQYALIGFDTARLILKIAVNAPYLFWEENQKIAIEAGVPSPYALFDLTQIFNDIYAFTNTTFSYALGGIYPKYTAGLGNVTREVANVYVAYFDYGWQVARRTLIGPNPSNASFYAAAWSEYPLCTLEVPIIASPDSPYQREAAGIAMLNLNFKNVWSGLYETAQVFDETVTQKWYNLATSLTDYLRVYYPPVATTVNLGIFSLANLQSTVLRQSVYVAYSILSQQPPLYTCFFSLGNVTRVTVDNFIDSIPDLWEFFLNIAQATQLSNAHFNCMNYNVPNFILSGSLKVYYFAGKMCNAHYTDGTLVHCDFAHPQDCPNYALPYADLSANLLCAADVAFIGVLKTHVQLQRLAFQWAEKEVIELIACIIDFGNPVACNRTEFVSLNSQIAEASVIGCNTFESTVKVANVVSMLLGFAYNILYEKVIEGGGPAYNTLQWSGPEVQAYVTAKHANVFQNSTSFCEHLCSSQNTPTGCFSKSGNGCSCQWDGLKCHEHVGAHLSFQEFPLEAATTTFITSLFAPLFWAQYTGFVQFSRLATVLTIDPNKSLEDVATGMSEQLITLFYADQYFVFLDAIRIGTLLRRDIIVASVELIRTFLWVANECTGSAPCSHMEKFNEFEKVLMSFVTLLESLIQTFVNTVFNIVVQAGWILQDLAKIVLGGSGGGPEKYLTDIFNRLFINPDSIFVTFIDELQVLVLSFPGIKEACETINVLISEVLDPLITFLNNILSFSFNYGFASFSLDSVLGTPNIPLPGLLNNGVCSKSYNVPVPEPSMCSTDYECTLPPSPSSGQCWIRTLSECSDAYRAAYPAFYNELNSFDYACPCAELTTGNFFCNVATGFCQEGISPFGDPLADCPAPSSMVNPSNNKSAFVDSTDYFDAMCWVLPAYQCGPTVAGLGFTDSADAYGYVYSTCMPQMILDAKLEGPYLCRDYCSPSSFDDDNVLLSDPIAGCFCALGMTISANQPPLDIAKDFLMDGLSLFYIPLVSPPMPPRPAHPVHYYAPSQNIIPPTTPVGWTPLAQQGTCRSSIASNSAFLGPVISY